MDKIIFYSTHCPRCRVVETKLKQKGLEYEEVNDVDAMLALGITFAPALRTPAGELLDFSAAIKWLNEQ